jgi:hypothetical protein
MPSSLPDAPTLLNAAIKYLEDELMPELSGYHRFKCRVTANVLNTIRRELEERSKQADSERKRLVSLLRHDGYLEELSVELASQIRAGKLKSDDAVLREHIRESLREALAINNPKWIRD